MQVKTIAKRRLKNNRKIIRDWYDRMDPYEIECYQAGICFMLQFLHTSPIVAHREGLNEIKRSEKFRDELGNEQYAEMLRKELDNVETWDDLKPITSGDWSDEDIPW